MARDQLNLHIEIIQLKISNFQLQQQLSQDRTKNRHSHYFYVESCSEEVQHIAG